MSNLPDLKHFSQWNNAEFFFRDVIFKIEGCKVLPFEDKNLREKILDVCKNVVTTINAEKHTERANEFGNAVEKKLREEMQRADFDIDVPTTKSGKKQSSGYPDCILKYGGAFFYIEVKTFSQKTKNSPMRTFFYSPSEDSKITCDASHIVIAFETYDNVRKLTGEIHCVDMFNKKVRLKIEYNTGNANLYAND